MKKNLVKMALVMLILCNIRTSAQELEPKFSSFDFKYNNVSLDPNDFKQGPFFLGFQFSGTGYMYDIMSMNARLDNTPQCRLAWDIITPSTKNNLIIAPGKKGEGYAVAAIGDAASMCYEPATKRLINKCS